MLFIFLQILGDCLATMKQANDTYFWLMTGSEDLLSVLSLKHAFFKWSNSSLLRRVVNFIKIEKRNELVQTINIPH